MDPLSAPRYALQGRVVTMDADFSVLDRAAVYVDRGRIVGVIPAGAPVPTGFEDVTPIETRGTIYPGLIDLHNHLSYNILPPLEVLEQFTNRDQWSTGPEYRKKVTGPMRVLSQTPGFVEAIVRYVEAKLLLGGVTTSQGISLSSNMGITRYYRGLIRNVEQTDEADLPEAGTRIPDVDAREADKFLARLKKSSCLLLHLSEGTDERARQHFEALRLPDGAWAITPELAGIHCVALTSTDYDALQANGGAMIWSPLSNLMLYGKTADIAAAKAQGLRMGIGSDWSPSGSKNLLGELKVARLVSAALGGVFADRDLLAMATRNAAEILKWHQTLGSLEAGKRADLLVVEGSDGDPYASLLEARETAIRLVVIDGVPRYGRVRLMGRLAPETERIQAAGKPRSLNLAQENADPVVAGLTLSEATGRLQDGLERLRELALELEQPRRRGIRALDAEPEQRWFLVLDHEEPAGVALRPHLPFGPRGLPTGDIRVMVRAPTAPLSQVLEPLELDSLTVAAGKDAYLEGLARQPNLPEYIKSGLPRLY